MTVVPEARTRLGPRVHRGRWVVVLCSALAIAGVAGVLVGVLAAWRPFGGPPPPSWPGAAAPGSVNVPGRSSPTTRAPERRRHRYVSPKGSDRRDGSRAHPWRTIKHAATHLRPGTTVHVAPGHYTGPLTIARGGTARRPVRVVADRRWRARISAMSTGSGSVVEIRGDHVTFEGFDVSGRGGDGTAGIDVEGNHDVVVANYVHDLAVPCLRSGNGGAGIVVGGGRALYRNRGGVIAGNLVERIGTGPRDGSCRLVHGIYAAVPRVTIVNNIVYGAVGDGITSWHAARALTIANNLSLMNGGAGILVGTGERGASSAGHTRTLVSNNIVYRNVLHGITETTDGSHRVGPGNRYLHNLTFANRNGDPDPDAGIDLFPGEIVSNNLNRDPRFARPSPAAGQYRLLASSPAVDAGTCAGAPRRDFHGSARPRGRGVDIGPMEFRGRHRRCRR